MPRPSADDWFREVYDRHHAQVLAYFLRRSCPDPEAAAADVFLVAWRRRRDLDSTEEMLPWLYGTARRVLANQRRSRFRLIRLTAKLRWSRPPEQPTPETVVVRREQDRVVLDALARLRPEDREVIQLSVWEELPRAAVGEIIGCSDRAATMRLHRAVRRLERELHTTTAMTRAQPSPRRTEATND